MSADHDDNTGDSDYPNDHWLVEPDGQDLAECYAEAANEAESAIRTIMQLADALEPVPGENARVDDLHHHAEYFGDLWKELRERERELADSDDEISVPDGADVERLLAQSEAERLPENYEHTPMPSLDLDTETMTLAYTENPDRYVKHPRFGVANNWLAKCPRAHENAAKVVYDFVSVGGSEWSDDVGRGAVFAIGSKRHDNAARKHFYAVTPIGLRDLGADDVGRRAAAQYLREQTERRASQ